MLFEIILRLYNERENDIEYDVEIIVNKYLNKFLKSRVSMIINCMFKFCVRLFVQFYLNEKKI